MALSTFKRDGVSAFLIITLTIAIALLLAKLVYINFNEFIGKIPISIAVIAAFILFVAAEISTLSFNRIKEKRAYIRLIMLFSNIAIYTGFIILYDIFLMKVDIVTAIIFLSSIVISIPISLIIHELGHLIWGVIAGLKFLALSIGKILIFNDNGVVRIKKNVSLISTFGYCICGAHKTDEPKKINFSLYYIGGCMSNIIVAIIAMIFMVLTSNTPNISTMLGGFAFCSLLLGINNLIPTNISGFNTDGRNILDLIKNPDQAVQIYNIHRINTLLCQGKTLAEMDAKLFSCDYALNSYISHTVRYMKALRYMQNQSFTAAEVEFRGLLDTDNFQGFVKSVSLYELAFCRIMLGADSAEIEGMLTDGIKKYIAGAKKYDPSINRFMYAYHMLIDNSPELAQKYLDRILSIQNNYHAPGEIKMDLMLIDYVDSMYALENEYIKKA